MEINNPENEAVELLRSSIFVHQLVNSIRNLNSGIHALKNVTEINVEQIKSSEVISLIDALIDTVNNSQQLLENYLDIFRKNIPEESVVSNSEEEKKVNVNTNISESLKAFKYQSKKLENEIELTLSPNLPSAVAIKHDLILAIQNLIDNSIHAIAANNKPGKISIKSYLIKDKIAIEVIDNGVGMTNEEISLALSGLHPSTKASSGIGLFLTSKLISQWGGSLSFFSEKYQGTTARILLDTWKSKSTTSGNNQVLILEDQTAQRLALELTLKYRGFKVNSAETATEAINLVQNSSYDVALLDINLESNADEDFKTGLDIARIFREHNPDALIIIISAYQNWRYIREAFDIGVDDWLYKADVNNDDLILRINEALPKKLEKASQRRETRRESIRREQLDRLLYETLSIFSHELRSPLVTAHWYLESLNSGALGKMTEKQLDAIECIRSAIRREFVLLDTHLDLSRLERGLETLNFQSFDLIRLMREEILIFEDAAKRKNIRIKATLPESVAIVKIDINRFRAALNPLMDNAIKFSSEGSEIEISLILESTYVEVQIADQGPGIKTEELDRLLGKGDFFEVNLKQRIRASGLGLSLAKRIIEDYHEGKMWFVKKRKGESGTTVAFRLSIQS